MTYEELVEKVASESVDILKAVYDDGVQVTDLMEVIQAGDAWRTAWNAFSKVGAAVTKEDLLWHVISRLPGKVVDAIKPLPAGEIPV